ncbi:hypothetical protein ACHAXA_001463 [Cyclostephanos tholiformis]|uniref:Uncharacterized protein n=1 Tax=Cyclostephanos tholiformis TaxID=382380 RepID=A0ABD3RZ43_9STRA
MDRVMTFKFTKVTIAAVLAFDVKHVVAYEEKQHIEGDDKDNVESLQDRGQKKRHLVEDTKAVGVTPFDKKGFDASTTTTPEALFEEPDYGILGTTKADKLPKPTTTLRKMRRGKTNKNCAKSPPVYYNGYGCGGKQCCDKSVIDFDVMLSNAVTKRVSV